MKGILLLLLLLLPYKFCKRLALMRQGVIDAAQRPKRRVWLPVEGCVLPLRRAHCSLRICAASVCDTSQHHCQGRAGTWQSAQPASVKCCSSACPVATEGGERHSSREADVAEQVEWWRDGNDAAQRWVASSRSAQRRHCVVGDTCKRGAAAKPCPRLGGSPREDVQSVTSLLVAPRPPPRAERGARATHVEKHHRQARRQPGRKVR